MVPYSTGCHRSLLHNSALVVTLSFYLCFVKCRSFLVWGGKLDFLIILRMIKWKKLDNFPIEAAWFSLSFDPIKLGIGNTLKMPLIDTVSFFFNLIVMIPMIYHSPINVPFKGVSITIISIHPPFVVLGSLLTFTTTLAYLYPSVNWYNHYTQGLVHLFHGVPCCIQVSPW